jgi:hypothetical protein
MGRHHLELIRVDKGKVSKTVPLRHADAKGERSYSSDSFLASALDGCEWSASRPGRALLPGERTPVPIGQEAG